MLTPQSVNDVIHVLYCLWLKRVEIKILFSTADLTFVCLLLFRGFFYLNVYCQNKKMCLFLIYLALII